jgi:RNA polymerase sigma-70 factor (ECF subfamily)
MSASIAEKAAVPMPAVREASFRGLFEANFAYVWNALRRLGIHESEREDLANEVFFRVHRALHTYDPRRPLRPWLFAFAFRVASDHRRLARHRIEVTGGRQDAHASARSPEAEVEREQQRALVREALEEVDLDKRAVLILHDLDEVPIPEIARALRIPEGTAYSRLRSGRAQFASVVRRKQRQEGEP